jgi:sugar/nucleoside kinase (ribokinase family)
MNDKPFDILIAGELNVDIIVTGDTVPEFGQVEKLVDDISVCAGSSSAIFAAAATRMGMRVLFASRVGDDLFGQFMIDALHQVGIDTSFIVRDPTIKTGVGIQLLRGQDRAMLTFLGSIGAVTTADVRPEFYHMARHLHVASPFLLTGLRPSMAQMMREAKKAGMTVSLDTNWDPENRWQLAGFFDCLDVFLPNENELRAISGKNTIEDGIREMEQRVPVLVVKQGRHGATGVCRGERLALDAFPVTVADTTGAGDSFDGGFLAGWLRGLSLRECLLLGLACGSLSTTQIGGFSGQPTWDQAVAYIRQHTTEDFGD